MIKAVHRCFLCRDSSHVLQHHYKTNFGISNKKIATYYLVENSKQPLFTVYIFNHPALREFMFPQNKGLIVIYKFLVLSSLVLCS